MQKKPQLETSDELEKAYLEIIPDFEALKVPVDRIKFRSTRSIRKVETFTTYGAYDQRI